MIRIAASTLNENKFNWKNKEWWKGKGIKREEISNTVNPQKIVWLSFPTLFFLVRLTFEVYTNCEG